MSTIEAAIRRANEELGRAAFVPFLTAGYPSIERCYRAALELVEAGADVLEIGIPFSDPLADGPVIQASSQAAMEAGVTPPRALELVERIWEASRAPIVVMSYLNPILQLDAKASAMEEWTGVSGLLLTDLPVDQPHPIWARIDAAGLDPILLVSPTTPAARVAQIAARGRGFLYCVSRMGVTGAGMGERTQLAQRVDELRSASSLPVLLGFGVSTAEDASEAAAIADGVVIGSALLRALDAEDAEDGGLGALRALADSIVRALQGSRA